MGPYGSQDFKTLLLLQIAAESFQTFSEFSSQWSTQNYVWDFWNFENWNFNDSFSLTWETKGAKTSKRYSSLKSVVNPFKLFFDFSSQWSSQKVLFWIFEILSFRFLTNFFFKFTIVPKNPIIWKTEWNLGLTGECSVYTWYFWHFSD